MKKTTHKTTSKTTKKASKKASKKLPPVDYDALWKDLLTEFLEEAVQFMIPTLWAAVDWSITPVFLQQEFINALKGKRKIKGKRKNADILARLQLKTGEDQVLLLHTEVQKALENDFPQRMYLYQTLTLLRYDMSQFTALAIFIGDAPPESQTKFEREHFGTKLGYYFNNFIVIEQDDEKLMASDNPIAIAILAAKYTHLTGENDINRFKYKRKVFELATNKKIPREKILNLLIFVHECMGLSPDLEHEFKQEFQHFAEEKNNGMYITQRSISLLDALYANYMGKSFSETLAQKDAEKEAEKAAILAQKEAEKAAILAQKEAEKATILAQKDAEKATILAQKDAEKINSILQLHKELGLSAEKISSVLNYGLAFVQNTIAEHFKK